MIGVCLIWDCRCEQYEWDGEEETDTRGPTCVCGHADDEHGDPDDKDEPDG